MVRAEDVIGARSGVLPTDRPGKFPAPNGDPTAPSTSSLRPSRVCGAEDHVATVGENHGVPTKTTARLCKFNGRLLSCPLLVLLSTTSWMFAVHCAKRTYVRGVNETSPYTIEAPFLLSYVTNLGFCVLYPCYLLARCTGREKLCTKAATMKLAAFLFGEKEKKLRAALLALLFTALWLMCLYGLFRALKETAAVEATAIFSIHPSFYYLLCWIVLQKKFIALRVIAFIVGTSGIIMFVYIDRGILWYKVIVCIGTAAFSCFFMLFRKLNKKPSAAQITLFFSVVGVTGTVLTWPFFIILSVLTQAEPWSFSQYPWLYAAGSAICFVGFTLTYILSKLWIHKGLVHLTFLLAIPGEIAIQELWLRVPVAPNSVKIGGFCLLIVSTLCTSLPENTAVWLSARFRRSSALLANHEESSSARPNPLNRQNRLKSVAALNGLPFVR